MSTDQFTPKQGGCVINNSNSLVMLVNTVCGWFSANVIGAIKNFTSLQQVNHCDSGKKVNHPDAAASCPISGPKTETESSQY